MNKEDIKLVTDPMVENLNDLIDLGNIWKNNKEKNKSSYLLKDLLIEACKKIVFCEEFQAGQYRKGSSILDNVQEYTRPNNLRDLQREKNYRMSVAAEEMASLFKAAYSEDMTPKEQLPKERRKWINEELEKYTDKHCCGNYVQIRDNGNYEMQGMFEEKHLEEIMGILKMAIE